MFNLEKLGLTVTESKVYIALLKEGCVPASIIIKRLGFHRATIYDVLLRLSEKGLVSSVIKNNKTYFEATSPKRFFEMIDEQKKEIEGKEKYTKKIVSELEKIKGVAFEQAEAKIYFGKEGLKTIMEDIIDDGKGFLSFGGEVRFRDILPVYTTIWAEKRKRKKIKARLIGTTGTTPLWYLNECRSLPSKYFSPASTIVYGHKVAIVLAEQPILIVLIENEKIALSYKSHFEVLWRMAKPEE